MKKATENQESKSYSTLEHSLIKQAIEGNTKAINKVLGTQMGMVDNLADLYAQKNTNNRLTKEDFLSAGYDGLMNSLKKFKLQEDSDFSDFSAYAFVCVKNSMLHLATATQNIIVSIDNLSAEDSKTYTNYLTTEEINNPDNWLESSIHEEDLYYMKKSKSKLPERTQEILDLRFTEKLKLREIAEYYGTSCQNIDNIINNSLAFIRKDMGYEMSA